MDFSVSEEQQLLKDEVSKVVKSFPDEYWREKDSKSEFPFEFWGRLAGNGWLGITIPQEYGGGGLGMLDLSMVVTEVARSGAGVMGGNLFTVASAMVPYGILNAGSVSLKERYLPKLARGELICSIVMTEPSAGVDTLSIDSFAEKRGGEYHVSGQKIWITFAPFAELMLLLARTTPKDQVKRRTEGLSLFLLDSKKANLNISKIDGLSMRGLASSQVFFDDVPIPEENMLGEEGKGWQTLAPVLNTERICTTSHVLGTGELVIEKASKYARERFVFGKPIGQNQGIQFPLADSRAKLEMAKIILMKAAWLYDEKKDCAFEANLVAYLGAQAAFEAADRAIQTFGGMGFAKSSDVERHWRDLRLWKTAPIPEQMVLSYIGQHILGLPRSY